MIAKERQRLAPAQTERTPAFTSGNFRPPQPVPWHQRILKGCKIGVPVPPSITSLPSSRSSASRPQSYCCNTHAGLGTAHCLDKTQRLHCSGSASKRLGEYRGREADGGSLPRLPAWWAKGI